jgi:hypothetical protein
MNARFFVEEICDKYGPDLEAIFLDSVDHFYELHREELLDISGITKAGLINDYIFIRMKSRFQSIEGFSVVEKGASRFLGYNSKVLIRFKKLGGRNRRPAVNPTISSQRFNSQQDMHLLTEKAFNVYLGYVLNRDAGNIDMVAFLCPNEDGNIAWTLDLKERRLQKIIDFPTEKLVETKKDRITVNRAIAESGEAR